VRPVGRVDKGAKIVPVSIERGLLKEADLFAKRHKLKRSQIVAQGLRLVMQKAG
jgi:metal-responsive CopG/Arc/MetJ family transcriptional regulator